MKSPYLKKGGGGDQESMKQEGQQVMIVACRPMDGVSPLSVNISRQQPFPTPSPFSFSAPSASSRPPIHFINLALRFSVLVFSFISALSLATPSRDETVGYGQHSSSSFTGFSQLVSLCQFVGYLLISSCSVATLTIQNTDNTAPLWKATVVSTIISYVTFLLVATSALLSGYKLCKRIIW